MQDNTHNGNGALAQECAPIPAWLLAPDQSLADELAVRGARLAGLDLRAEEGDES